MATMTEAQLSELLTALTLMTSVLTEVSMTPEASAPAKPKPAPKAPKAPAPEGPKLVCTRNMAAFRAASGTKYQKAVRVAEDVRDGKLQLPVGWAFGPVYADFVANGKSRDDLPKGKKGRR